MKLICCRLLVLVCWGLACLPTDAKPKKATRPSWLQMIDQGKKDPRLKGYFTPNGIKLEIVADYPVVTNPVGMTFADDGTLYVLEWKPFPGQLVDVPWEIPFKDGKKRMVSTRRKALVDKKGKVVKLFPDMVKVLRDTKAKGVYDQSAVVLEVEQPSSILCQDGWLYLANLGTVRRYKQTKPGGPYDIQEVVAQGFYAGDGQALSLAIGQDGWLYIASGGSPNWVEGADGRRVTVLDRAVFRCRPDGSRMQIYSIGYGNPWNGAAFDAAGNLFHIAIAAKDADERPYPIAEAHVRQVRHDRHGGLPGGLLFYDDTRFPEHFRGLFYYPDGLRRTIRACKLEPIGATFEVAEDFDFLKSSDPLFRPCQVGLGPDGAMYIADWRSTTKDGKPDRLRGDNKHGRIYRLSWVGTGHKNKDGEEKHPALKLRGLDSWAKIAKGSDEEILKTLSSDDGSFRWQAQREIIRRGAKQRPALLKLLEDPEASAATRLAVLGALQSLWNDDVAKAFGKLLDDPEPDVRRLAAEGLSLHCAHADKTAHAALLERLTDTDHAVRRSVALAIGRIAAPGAADALVNTFQFDDGKDAVLREGLVRAIERLGKEGMEKLLDLANSGEDKARAKVVDAFASLHTRPAAAYLPRLLDYPHLTVGQQATLVGSYANYRLEPPLKLDDMLAYLIKHPQADDRVLRAGIEVLTQAPASLTNQARSWLFSLLDQAAAHREVQHAAITLLGRDSPGARELARRLLAKKLPPRFHPQITAVLEKCARNDPEAARLLAELKRIRP